MSALVTSSGLVSSTTLNPFQVLAQLDLPLAQVDRLFEVLVRDRRLHLLDHLLDLLLERRTFWVSRTRRSLTRSRLVDDVDRLVRQVRSVM
jgi:hypothetical protein